MGRSRGQSRPPHPHSMRDAIETVLAVAVLVALVVTGKPGPDLTSAPPPRAFWAAFSG